MGHHDLHSELAAKSFSVFHKGAAEESRSLKNKPFLVSGDGDCTVPVFPMQSGNYFHRGPQTWWLHIDLPPSKKSNSVTNTEVTLAGYTAAKSVFLAATK